MERHGLSRMQEILSDYYGMEMCGKDNHSAQDINSASFDASEYVSVGEPLSDESPL